MTKKGLTAVLSLFMIGFYIAIILYIIFAILHIDTLENFEAAMAFEIIGFVFLILVIMGNIVSENMKTGFFVPLLMTTITYTVILDVINIACIITMPHVLFMLVNFIILFIYCLISIPMLIMGRK